MQKQRQSVPLYSSRIERGSIRAAINISLCFLLLLSAIAGFSQEERATITGAITDASGAALPAATVKVTNDATNVTVTLQTDSSGLYSANNLNPGSYTIEVSKSGFSTHIDKGFTVQVSQVARLDVKLSVGSVSQTVQVVSAAPMMQTENAAVGQVVSSTDIASLPLNGRNFAELAMIAPGVTGMTSAPPNSIQSGVRPDELRPGGSVIIANGAEDNFNKMMMDGIDNTEIIAQTFVVRPALGGIAEFNVLTTNAGAEYDRGAGTIIVTSTKSGGNSIHGILFEDFRNSYLDAKNYFDLPAPAPIPPYKLNDLGGGIGGPILRNKLFYFADWEGYFERLASTVVTTVPTAAMKQGNFGGVAHIYNPATTVANGTGGYTRTEFPNDIIPASSTDPLAAQITALYPAPQTAALVNNYVSNPLKDSAENRADARIDYSAPFNQSIFARYSEDNTGMTLPNTYNNAIGGNIGQFSGPNRVVGQNMVLGDNIAISPNLAAEYRFGLERFSNVFTASVLTAPVWATVPGYDEAGLTDEPSAPIIEPGGYGGLGDSRSMPQIRFDHTLENIGDVTWLRGKHSMKFGVDILNILVSEHAQVSGTSPFGLMEFTGTFTNNPATGAGGNAIADMLVGDPQTTSRQFFLAKWPHVVRAQLNFYGQDSWQVSPKLTLNYGAHYQIDGAGYERNNEWVNFDVATSSIIIAGQNGVARSGGLNTFYGDIGPRLGFAYRISDKLVLRGGYGIYYDTVAAANRTREVNWPFAYTYSFVTGDFFPNTTVSQGFFPPTAAELATPSGVIAAVAPNFRTPTVQDIDLALQHQLSSHSTVSLTYGGSLGQHRDLTFPIDQPAPGPGTIQTRRPYDSVYPLITSIAYSESVADSAYNSMQVSYEDRMDHGLTIGGNYVWSHSLDNSGGDGGSNGPDPQDPTNFRADWGSSSNDSMNRVNVYGTYELPFGPGRAFLGKSTFLNKEVLGGWHLDGVALMQSGYPFTVTTSEAPTNTGATGRANVVPGVSTKPAVQSLSEWFNTAAFTTPPAYDWGDSARNSLRGPSNTNLDFTAAKVFPVYEQSNLEFRGEVFNIFNHPEFTLPAAEIGATGVGTITATSHASRQIQLVLKLTF